MSEIGYDSGKLVDVAYHLGPHRRREYGLLLVVFAGTSLAMSALALAAPLPVACLLLFAAYFQLLATFAKSTTMRTSHHIRFLLAGSNPIGMTGASSLLLGAVDVIVDWREDQDFRRRSPIRYWSLTVYKFVMTPVGGLLLVLEYAWDACLLARPGMIPLKWRELFSLAWYHPLICPEKSNDVFYADLAYARYRQDAFLYQWNRLRALVFEFEHYRQDVEQGLGVPETNIFWQDPVTAYQTLKRLRVEELEKAVATHFRTHPKMMPVPQGLGQRLVANARPLGFYLRVKESLADRSMAEWERRLHFVCRDFGTRFQLWHILWLLDTDDSRVVPESPYLTPAVLHDMEAHDILQRNDASPEHYAFTTTFRQALDKLLADQFRLITDEEREQRSLARLPTYLTVARRDYAPLE